MALLLENALDLVLGELQKAVSEQIIQSTRFKIALTRLEITLKRIESVFHESWRIRKVLNRPQQETILFISYLCKAKDIVLKCSSIKYRIVYKKILYSNKLIRLNSKLLRFFQIQLQAKTMTASLTNSNSIRVYPDQIFDFQFIGSLANLTSIRFEHVSFCSSIHPIFTLPFLHKLSFVMCELGDALTNSITESPYMLPNLTDLEFDSCYDLRELPSGICDLHHLQNLSITNCHELDALPEKLGNLSNLEILNLHCCTKLQELPESFGSLCNLSFLDLSDCLSISLLPEQFGELCGLRGLNMSGVHGLQELPESMSKLLQLEEVICDEETSYLWMDFESDLYNLRINLVQDDRFESFMKIVY